MGDHRGGVGNQTGDQVGPVALHVVHHHGTSGREIGLLGMGESPLLAGESDRIGADRRLCNIGEAHLAQGRRKALTPPVRPEPGEGGGQSNGALGPSLPNSFYGTFNIVSVILRTLGTLTNTPSAGDAESLLDEGLPSANADGLDGTDPKASVTVPATGPIGEDNLSWVRLYHGSPG